MNSRSTARLIFGSAELRQKRWVIVVAVVERHSRIVAAITAVMPLGAPLALWIVYAANNTIACVPAVPWGSCGMNRPDPVPEGSDYCLGSEGAAPWQIRFATIEVDEETRVNTAFPNR